jgi:hypothetical protein
MMMEAFIFTLIHLAEVMVRRTLQQSKQRNWAAAYSAVELTLAQNQNFHLISLRRQLALHVTLSLIVKQPRVVILKALNKD